MMKFLMLAVLLHALCPAIAMGGIQKADSLKSLLPSVEGTEKADVLLQLSKQYRDDFQLKLALAYGHKALKVSESTNDHPILSACYNDLGILYRMTGKNDSALIYFDNALILREELGNKSDIAYTLSSMGVSYRKLKDFDKAAECFLRALNIYNALNDEPGIGRTFNNMSILYSELEDYDNSLRYIRLYLDQNVKLQDSTGIAKAYNNMGLAYKNQGEFEQAMDCYMLSLGIKTSLNDWGGMMVTHINIADLSVLMGDNNNALRYYLKVINDWKRKPTSVNITKVYCHAGNVYTSMKHYEEAEYFLLEALDKAQESKGIDDQEMVLQALVDLYTQQHSYKEAFEYMESYKLLIDSTYTTLIQQQVNRIDAMYKLDREERDASFAKEKKLLQLRVLSVATIAILVVVLIYLLGQNAIKRRANIALQAEKEKAQESDRLKSAFLANMSHEIRTPMNAVLGFTDLLRDPDLKPDELNAYVDVIEDGGQRMLTIINDLVDISKIESGVVDINLSDININEQVNSILFLLRNEADTKGLELRFAQKSETHVLKTDHEKLQAILLNLIKNAIKFTSTGYVETGYSNTADEFEFYVKDTGTGISEDKRDQVFERFVQAEKNGITEGTGLGLSITKAYVEMLGGKIWFTSEPGKGTTFFFTISKA
ncbi:tetratricopeptide repeat protein [Carboxylicivirga sp. RSCT41]|uniref:tetratricopeptide repeat protein n=1 Tax=Carboxylicivirga agarovorans TaxID=3417570 RepID=UPI003D34BC7B